MAKSLAVCVMVTSGVYNPERQIVVMTKSFLRWNLIIVGPVNGTGFIETFCTQRFEVGPGFLENVCTPLLGYTEHL